MTADLCALSFICREISCFSSYGKKPDGSRRSGLKHKIWLFSCMFRYNGCYNARSNGLFTTVCKDMVALAVRILEEIIE